MFNRMISYFGALDCLKQFCAICTSTNVRVCGLLSLAVLLANIGFAPAQTIQAKDRVSKDKDAVKKEFQLRANAEMLQWLRQRVPQEVVQDKEEAQKEMQRRIEAELRLEVIRRQQVLAQQAVPALIEQQLNAYVFRQDRSPDAARRRLEATLTANIEEIGKACKLTQAQEDKLQLMGQGDIKRFFDKYETLREKYLASNSDRQTQANILRESGPLQQSLQKGLFGDGSLFQKSVPNTLNKEQTARYESVIRERIQTRHRDTVQQLLNLLEQGAEIPREKRDKLVTILTKDIKPAVKSAQYDFYYLVWQLHQLPEERYKPLLTDWQWTQLQRYLAQSVQLEATLRQAGYFAEKEDEPEEPDALTAPSKPLVKNK